MMMRPLSIFPSSSSSSSPSFSLGSSLSFSLGHSVARGLFLVAAVALGACASSSAQVSPSAEAGPAGAGGAGTGGSAGTGGTSSGASGAANGSTGGTNGAGEGGVSANGTFTLLFRDDFEGDKLDPTRWQVMTHSWDGNLALFSSKSVSTTSGNLALQLLPAPSGTVDDQGAAKSFFGAEVRSKATLTYGRVRSRAKLAGGSAVISALVTIYTPWPADNWNELDIECLGAQPGDVQFNTMVYTGPPTTPPVTKSVTPTQEPHKVKLAFDPSADFHVYTTEWTPAGARFLVDDQVQYEWTKNISLMKLPQNVLLTIWASSSAGWAGAVTEATSMASATFDWVELYEYR